MADWEPAEQVARNAEGKHVALKGGAWVPVDSVAKNAEGKYMVTGGASPTPQAAKPQPDADYALREAALDEPSPHLAAAGGALSSIGEGIGQGREHIVGWLAERLGNMLGTPEQAKKNKQAVGKRLAGVDEEVRSNARARDVLGEQHPLTRITGAGTDVALGFALPGVRAAEGAGALGRIGANALTGSTYSMTSPVTEKGDFASHKLGQLATGTALGAGLGTAFEMPTIAGNVKKALTRSPTQAAEKSGAPERVVGEMQRQRDVQDKRAKPEGGSEMERATTDFEERMKPLREEAFREPGRIDTTPTLKMIDALAAKNPDAKVRAALKEVRETIDRAMKGGQQAAPSSGKMTTAEYRAMQGRSGSLDVPMLDEVRQSINRMIEQKGDNALDKHTKDILSQVREELVGRTPESYKGYLKQFTEGKAQLDKYKPSVSLLGRTTTDQRGAPIKAGSDAEAVMEGVFSGKTSNADLKELVERTKHDKKMSADVRRSLSEWINKPDPVSKVASSADMIKRWEKARDSIKNSGLLPPDHVVAIDKVMDDLRKSEDAVAMKKGAATVGGFLAGMLVGHPFMGSHFARDAVTNESTAAARSEVSKVISALAVSDGRVAEVLAKKPTKELLEQLSDKIQLGPELRKALTIGMSRKATQPPPSKKRPNQLGMRPSGL